MQGLTSDEIQQIKEELNCSKNPIFLFHDDADGLCSYLLLRRFCQEGKGIIIKSRPSVDEKFVPVVQKYDPDKIFVLDIAILKQEFADSVKLPVVWIDHHEPKLVQGVKCFNPRRHNKGIVYPVTNICYDVVKNDIWIAMAGCIGDWHIPSFRDEFQKQYPDMLSRDITDPARALFESDVGKIARICNFILKGNNKEANKCVGQMLKIKSPTELLNEESDEARYIMKKYKKTNELYQQIVNDVKNKIDLKDNFIIYEYQGDQMSFTGELSNELLYLYPDKIIIIAREKNDEMRMSIRSKGVTLPDKIQKALSGLQGYGGGHEYACGACVLREQFQDFVKSLREQIV